MKTAIVLVAAFAAASALAQSPADAMKGKMKPGLYSYKMEMDMGQVPGMPKGMDRKQVMSFQHCVTPQDIAKGELGKGRESRGPQNCEMKDFRMSGNTATYRVVCQGDAAMTSEQTVTFVPDGFDMTMKMAMNRGGQAMNMAQKMQGRYVGPCAK